MNTAEIKINTHGVGMEEALSATEKLGLDCGLSHKENLRLRLLAEELIGLMRGITGNVEAVYRASREEKSFALRLSADVVLDQDMRKELLAASTSGKNTAARGFMGKIREMIAIVLLPKSQASVMASMSLGLISLGSPMGYAAGEDIYTWSMNTYMTELKNNTAEEEKVMEARDELEKSIVANLADDVSVNIVGSRVEITITKAF
jgi:hypothetical protein